MSKTEIRPFSTKDTEAVWKIFRTVVARGDTYAFAPETTFDEFREIWLGERLRTYVAVHDGGLLGTYILKQNQPGLGSHIANCGYMTHPDARGYGLGTAMCEHSIEEARRLGYRGMQFNLVVSTNESAVRLWRKLGFEIIGTVPGAFHHRERGYVNAHIMFRDLS